MRPISASAVAVVAALLAMPAAAKGPPGEDHHDANCYVALSLFAAAPPAGVTLSPESRQAFDSASNYFPGKLKGRSPTLDLATVMTPVIIRDVQANLRAQLDSCIPDTYALAAAVGQTADLMEATAKAR